jgi:hypothetical protein
MNTHKAALCRLILGCNILLVVTGSYGRDLPKGSGGRPFCGVVPSFGIVTPMIRKGDVMKVRLVLKNESSEVVKFRYGNSFRQHITVYDAHQQEVPVRLNAPFLESGAATVTLKPGRVFSTVVMIDLWPFYDLPMGTYGLRFFYDLRLIPNEECARRNKKLYRTKDLLLWDTRSYPFSVRD